MQIGQVKTLINKSELMAKREINSVDLIAVSKTQSNEKIEHILKEGHRSFGENRVQEAYGKWPILKKH